MYAVALAIPGSRAPSSIATITEASNPLAPAASRGSPTGSSGTAIGIQRALEKAQAGQAKGKAIADDAKSKVGPVQNAGKGPKNIFGPSSSGDGSDDDDDDSGGSGKPDGAGKPADAGSQGSKGGNKGNSGD